MKNNIKVQASELWFKENDLTYQKLSNIGDANVILKVKVEELINDLEKYKRRPSPNEFYIKKQSYLISSLVEVLQIQKFYLYHDYLIDANEQIISILKNDNVLDGVNVKFLFNKNNQNFGRCTVGVGI